MKCGLIKIKKLYKCAPLYWLSYFYIHVKQNSFKSGVLEKNKALAVAFNSTFRYIDDVLFINNCYFHSYVNSIYPNELEIKDTTYSETTVSYLAILLEKDVIGEPNN